MMSRILDSFRSLLLLLSCFVVNHPVTALSASTPTGGTTITTTTSPTSTSVRVRNNNCIVIGGGPVGLASALTLSNPPHCMNVIVLEKTVGDTDVSKYDPTRSYLYNVNPRGLTWFVQHCENSNNALEKLMQRGCAPRRGGMASIVIVPADPQTPIELPRPVAISSTVQLKNRTNYWIPRHQMIELLQECCQEHEIKRKNNNNNNNNNENTKNALGSIELLSGKCVESVETTKVDNEESGSSGDIVTVRCQDGTSYSAALVVAADGIDSSVRKCLSEPKSTGSSSSSSSSWLQSNPDSFVVKRYKSPATGLKLKALQIPPNFTLKNTDGSIVQSESETIYAFRGLKDGTRDRISLGLLPVKDPTMIRPANTNTRPNHEIWDLKTGAEAKEWFKSAFPRLPLDEWVDDDEWERFVQAKGTTFPYCQYSPGSAVAAPDGLAGVVLVGDACHAFPPDIGQGINAGLQDVVALDRALRGLDIPTGTKLIDSKPTTVGEAILNYQENRGPEHAALIRLARFGAPYQYRQPWIRDRIGSALWAANVALRLFLNKVSGGLVPPAAIQLANQDFTLTFREIMNRADTTTLVLQILVIIPILWKIVDTFIM